MHEGINLNAIVVNISLAVILREIEDYLKLEINNKCFRSSKRVSTAFLDELLKQPIVLYLPLHSIVANIGLKQSEQVIPFIRMIHYTPFLHVLQFIYLSYSIQDIGNREVECVFVEAKKNIAKTQFLYDLLKIDSLLLKNTSNFTGKIDYEKLEQEFHTAYAKAVYKKLVKKPGKYFFQNLLGLNLHHKNKVKTKG